MKLDLNDLTLVPARQSHISSRKEIGLEYLPLIISPMESVVDSNNYTIFKDLGFEVCIPRYCGVKDKSVFISYGLNEFEELLKLDKLVIPNKILIDVANGHIAKIPILIKKMKELKPSVKLMVGNIANPLTFKDLAEAGADYIRCGIGGGTNCISSVQTGIHYPMASLLYEIKKIKDDNNLECKIVADGGFRNYKDIITAINLGADYVMIGSIANKAIESCGDNYFKGIKINKYIANLLFKYKFKIHKKYRGMATKEVQKIWNKEVITTSEGIVTKQKVDYKIGGWLENFTDYLKSSMSYSGCRNLKEFVGLRNVIEISPAAYKRYWK